MADCKKSICGSADWIYANVGHKIRNEAIKNELKQLLLFTKIKKLPLYMERNCAQPHKERQFEHFLLNFIDASCQFASSAKRKLN